MIAPARILVVEDEPRLGELLRLYLERDGHAVTVVADGRAAIAAIDAEPVDLVVLDLMLPGIGGEAVLSAIRDRGDTPVLIASAKRSDQERIAGLRMGADDYLAKPYNPHELTARVAAVLRRSRGTAGSCRASSGRKARTSTSRRCRSMPGGWSWIRRAGGSPSTRSAGRRPPHPRRTRPAGGPGPPAGRGPHPRPAPRLGHPAAGRGLRSGRGRPRGQPAAQARRRRRGPVAHRDDPADGLPTGRVAGPRVSGRARRSLAWRLGLLMGITVIAVLLLVGIVVNRVVSDRYETVLTDQQQQRLDDAADILADRIGRQVPNARIQAVVAAGRHQPRCGGQRGRRPMARSSPPTAANLMATRPSTRRPSRWTACRSRRWRRRSRVGARTGPSCRCST